MKKPAPWHQLTGLIRLPQETLILCVVSLLDVVMTYRLLTREDISFVESNPFARYFLYRWGMKGMAYFKVGMTVIVCVVTQIIARPKPELARKVLGVAILIIAGVVIYSAALHFKHREVIEVGQAQIRLPLLVSLNSG